MLNDISNDDVINAYKDNRAIGYDHIGAISRTAYELRIPFMIVWAITRPCKRELV
jgi:hypothetical protein